MWIEPDAHQIVKYTFDNIDFDFLPAQWLVRLGNVRATMTMHQPFPDVWLPRDLEFLVDAQVAVGPLRRPLERGVSRLPAAGREVEVQCRPGTVDDSTRGLESLRNVATETQSHGEDSRLADLRTNPSAAGVDGRRDAARERASVPS